MRVGSLFSGVGAMDAAVLSVLGGSVAWHSDIDPAACRVLAERWPGVPNLGDVSEVDWTTVEPVDVMTGGFPCTDVSLAGRQLGLTAETRSGLWSHMAAAISVLQPHLVVIENVPGLLSARADSDVQPCPWCVGDLAGEPPLRALGAVLADLAHLGFDAEWISVPASGVGCPHQRLRVFILAWPADAADAGRERLQRRADGRGVAGTESARAGEGLQRQRRGHAAGDGGAAAADAGGEARTLRPGLRADGSGGLGRGRPDDGAVAAAADPAVGGRGSGRRGPEPAGPRRPAGPGETDGGEPGAGAAAADTDTDGAGLEGGQRRTGTGPAGRRRRPDDEADAVGSPPDAADPGRRPAAPDVIGAGSGQEVRGGPPEPRRRDQPAPDADGGRREGDPQPHGGPEQPEQPAPRRADAPGRVLDPGGGHAAAADPASVGRGEGRPEPAGQLGGSDAAERGDGRRLDWGIYEPAIRRWERILGRVAPEPTVVGSRGGRQLNPRFVEWMQGLPEGWVTGVAGVNRNGALRVLGGLVPPQQCAAALRELLARMPHQREDVA